jgi:hypothetical protein
MSTPLEEVARRLRQDSGLEVTLQEAEDIAVRSKGSVEAYLEWQKKTSAELDQVIESDDSQLDPSHEDKFTDELVYDIEQP